MLAAECPRRETGNGPTRVFVDVTTSMMLAGESPIGISRVEREIARRLLQARHLNPVPVVFRRDGSLLAVGPEQLALIFPAEPIARAEEIQLRQPRSPARAPGEHAVSPAPTGRVTSLRLRASSGLRRAARAGIAYIPGAVREDVRAILIHARQIARTAAYRRRAPIRVSAGVGLGDAPAPRDTILPQLRMIVHPGPGDVLWTGGLYSNFVPLRTIAEMRTRSGFKVATVCYDLIRVMHPEFNPPSMGSELFAADAVAMLDSSDLVLAISESTRGHLLDFAKRTGRAMPPVQVVQLGCDLATRQMPADHQDPPLLRELTQRRFALAVGTVEPRKNLRLLLRVWERLVADPTFQLDLIIVGRAGFEADDSASEIECSPLFGKRILWLEQCPDAALRRLYEAAHIVLYPSFVEGWGLPVTEALSFGRHVIASDRGAMKEAGFGLARLLDPEDEAAWAAAIADAAATQRMQVFLPHPPSWDSAAEIVERALCRLRTAAEVV